MIIATAGGGESFRRKGVWVVGSLVENAMWGLRNGISQWILTGNLGFYSVLFGGVEFYSYLCSAKRDKNRDATGIGRPPFYKSPNY